MTQPPTESLTDNLDAEYLLPLRTFLKQRRREFGFSTQESLGKAMGCDRSHISRYERGAIPKKPWGRHLIRGFSKTLQLDLEELEKALESGVVDIRRFSTFPDPALDHTDVDAPLNLMKALVQTNIRSIALLAKLSRAEKAFGFPLSVETWISIIRDMTYANTQPQE